MGESSSEQGGQESNVHLATSSGTILGTTKEPEKCEGTLGSREGMAKDNSNDSYDPWVVVAQRRGGNKATKKEVPTDQNLFKIMGSPKGGVNDKLRHEGKRKVSVGLIPNGAHMQNVVQPISIGPKSINQRPSKESGGIGSSRSNF